MLPTLREVIGDRIRQRERESVSRGASAFTKGGQSKIASEHALREQADAEGIAVRLRLGQPIRSARDTMIPSGPRT